MLNIIRSFINFQKDKVGMKYLILILTLLLTIPGWADYKRRKKEGVRDGRTKR